MFEKSLFIYVLYIKSINHIIINRKQKGWKKIQIKESIRKYKK